MPKRMILHDSRLLGTAPPIAQNTYVVNAAVPIAHCVAWVGQYASSQGGLDELLIMCHGGEADWNLTQQTCTGKPVGGFGLQLCAEWLKLENVNLTARWNGLIHRITIYSCAAADTGSGNANTVADGRRFMGEMAGHTGAEVIAARDTQLYTHSATSKINFGNWEGPVYRFSPVDGSATTFSAGPMS